MHGVEHSLSCMISENVTLTVAIRACQAEAGAARANPYAHLSHLKNMRKELRKALCAGSGKSSQGFFCRTKLFREQRVNGRCLKGQLHGTYRRLPDKLNAVGGNE